MCFVGIGAPSAACNLARLTPRTRHHADLRERHHRHQAQRAAALDRRRRAVRDGAHHRVGAGDVSLLAAGRPYHRRLSRRRADRPLRQSQHHGDRPLRQAEGAAARRRRRARDRHLRAARSSSSWRRADARSSTSSTSSPRSATARAPVHRERLGVTTKGPTRVVTDLCVMEPDATSKELTVVGHASRRDSRADRRGHWLADQVRRPRWLTHAPPTAEELAVLRDLQARTKAAMWKSADALSWINAMRRWGGGTAAAAVRS